MALWGKTDATGSKPKYLSTAAKANAVFVSKEEALLGTNKSKGITGAGWWLLNEYTDSSGTIRYKAECLVAMTIPNSVSGDATDDAKVADIEIAITISAQPEAILYYADSEVEMSVTASVNSGTLTYQWQKKLPAGTRWTNIVDATSAGYTTDTLVLADNNTEYRVIIGSSSGAKKVTSEVAKVVFD